MRFGIEIVGEAFTDRYRTLRHHKGAIHVLCPIHEHSMPMDGRTRGLLTLHVIDHFNYDSVAFAHLQL